MQQTTTANLYLILTSAIWGITFPLIRNAVAEIDPNLFVVCRFTFAALIFLPFVIKLLKNTPQKLLLNCIVIGSLNAIAYISQTIGLQTIDSSRSAFITGFSVILIPFLAPLFKVGSIKVLDILCSLICLVGLYILTGADFKLETGEAWTLLAAIAFALQLTYIQRMSTQLHNVKLVTFYQILFTVPLALFFSWHTKINNLFHLDVIIGLLFCAVFATIIVFFIQLKYQKFVTATRTALIFSLEPVFATIFGLIINGEKLTKHSIFGGLIILISILLPTFIVIFKKYKNG